jgi:penicillin-binding protein 1A
MADNLSRKARRSENKSEKNNKTGKRAGLFQKDWLKKAILVLMILLLIGVIAGGISAFAIIRGAPDLDHEQLTLAQNPEILDMDGEVVTTLESSENRRSADIEEVPEVMKDAVLSIEDARFYDHFGIDLRRVGGAVVANFRSGFGSEGASTITQQVVKNLYFDFDKTITRKLQEQYLAVQLEQHYTKDQILEMYVNAIYFSDGRYGIVEAANYYFSKDLSELNIEDAALLAGIPQRPTAHNPFNHPEAAENRRNTVIDRMVHYDKISEQEGEQAKSVPIEEQLEKSERETGQYQSYIDEVLNEVENIDGIESSDIYTGGMTIHTNLDQDLQEHVETVMQSDEYIQFPDEYMQAGITLMNTKNGQVHAIGGMREEAEAARGYNWATNPSRQAGSTSKPIFAYGPAIDNEQWSTYHQLTDEPHQYSDADNTPVTNFNSDSYRGDVSIREALKDSLNIPAVKALQETGLNNAEEFAERLGIEVETMVESYALGANGTSSFEMAGAYGAFGNQGNFNEPHTVRQVEFPDGQIIDMSPEETRAMNDYTAFMVSDMLRDVLTDGTASRLQLGDYDAAGKTGSSNFTPEDRDRYNIPSGGQPDAWFVGYSPELTASVWTGYPSHADGYISRDNNEHHISMDIFEAVMNYSHEGMDTENFHQPDSVVEVAIEESTGLLPSSDTPESEIIREYFVRGTEPESVSEEFESEDASGIQNLSASYNEENNSIDIEWSFPEDELESFSLLVEASVSGSDSFTTVDTTKQMSSSISDPDSGETYTIRVTPVDEDNESAGDSSSVEVTVPDETDDENNNEIENNEEENDPQNNEENETPENESNIGNGNENENENNEDNENEENTEENSGENNSSENNNNGSNSNNNEENTPEEENSDGNEENNSSNNESEQEESSESNNSQENDESAPEENVNTDNVNSSNNVESSTNANDSSNGEEVNSTNNSDTNQNNEE